MIPQLQGLGKILFKPNKSGCPTSKFSFFWKGVTKHSNLVEVGFIKSLGNGKTIRFWTDRWMGECALSSAFPYLFSIANDPKVSVYDALKNTGTTLSFCRQLVGIYKT